MRLLDRLKKHRRGKQGFTLIECIVSIAIFAIMATMFATFLISSVRVVNLAISNERDREALLEAISAAKLLTNAEDVVELQVVVTNRGEVMVDNLDGSFDDVLDNMGQGSYITETFTVKFDCGTKNNGEGYAYTYEMNGKQFCKFKSPTGIVYCVFLGKVVPVAPEDNLTDNKKPSDSDPNKPTGKLIGGDVNA